VLYRPSGRPSVKVMDWVNDGGQDEPLSERDSWILTACIIGLFGVGAIGGLRYALLA
jgi:hypothetical protein